MMRAWMAALASAMLLLSAGCALREQKPAGAWLEQRQAWFLAHPEWSVQGRLGLSDGRRGGSLSMRWRAVGEHHVVDLSAGLGGKRWRLEMTPSGATLTGTDLAPLHGPDPDVLVERAVGWPIPVTWMSHWLRGLPAPERARLEFAADGTLERLAWAGGRLEYLRWRGSGDVRPLLPSRIEATSGRNSVRAALSGWQFEPANPPAATESL